MIIQGRLKQFAPKSLGYNLSFCDDKNEVCYTLKRVSEARYFKLLEEITTLVDNYKPDENEIITCAIPYLVSVKQVFRGYGEGRITYQVVMKPDAGLHLKMTGWYKPKAGDFTPTAHSIYVPISDILEEVV